MSITRFVEICAAMDHGLSYDLPLPEDWAAERAALQRSFARTADSSSDAYTTVLPCHTGASASGVGYVDLTAPTVSALRRQFAEAAYSRLMSTPAAVPPLRASIPWWETSP